MLPKIVVIDDNPADAKILQIALARRDPRIQVLVICDGAQATEYFSSIRKADESSVDLILLDLNLPRVSGFEVLEFLKSNNELRKLPVVVLSGSSSRQDIARCYAAGANSYICKPVELQEVFNVVDQLVTYWFHLVRLPSLAPAQPRAL